MAHFVPYFSHAATPLRDLLRNDIKFVRGEKEEAAFKDIKQRIARAQITEYSQMDIHTELIVDASPVGLGAVLLQRSEDGLPHIVECASQPLTQTERNYSQAERELLGVICGCEHFHVYLYGD